jgi:prolyl-tRNA synthetase
MRQSELFTKTRKEAPKDEVAKNAKLLIRGGFIHKEMAGVYSYLPLGLRVLNKIVGIIRQEMDAIGGQEIFLSAFQNKEVWQKTNRWDEKAVDIWFKTKLKTGAEIGLGFTHEEPLTNLMRDHIQSFRDLPRFPYQFQTKFRSEERAKSGIMRCREFLMKDLYSFCRSETEHQKFYDRIKESYLKIFNRVGLGDKTYLTFASGGSFSKYSHEFQTVTENGEDIIHLCEKCKVAVNDEIIAEQSGCPICGHKTLRRLKAVEVGNIFSLGTKFSDAIGLNYIDEKGDKKAVIMGSYGIGPGRLLGAVVEVLSDWRGIVWPAEISPFTVQIVPIDYEKNPKVKSAAEKLYENLLTADIEVLFDDRPKAAGEKFADADLIGVPLRVAVSDKTLAAGKFELKNRKTGTVEMVGKKELILMAGSSNDKK